MNFIPRYFYLLAIPLVLSCSNQNPDKDVSNIQPEINISERTSKVELDTLGSVKFSKYNHVPGFIRKYLNSVSGSKFSIANPGKPYSQGCTRFPGSSDKQLIWAAMNKTSFQMEYWQGGIALSKYLITIKHREHNVEAFSIQHL